MSAPMKTTAEVLSSQSTEPPQIESKPVLVVVARPDVSLVKAEAAPAPETLDTAGNEPAAQTNQVVQPIGSIPWTKIKLNLAELDALALLHVAAILNTFFCEGILQGNEYEATNYHKFSANLGRFIFNLGTAWWSSVTAANSGRGVISYMAYMFDCTIYEAAW